MRRPFKLMINAVLAAGLVALIAAQNASPHVVENGKWFIGGHTVQTNGDGRIDPLNVIFKGSNDGNPKKVDEKSMIDKWVNGSRGDLRNQGEPKCLSDQAIYYQHPRELDTNDLNQKSGCYEDAWHVRIWDSVEHDERYHPQGTPQRDTWAIMGVHYDLCCPDEPGLSWEKAAISLKKELNKYCSVSNWRHLIGSGPVKFQGRFSDGILTRVSPEVVGPGPCG